MATFNFAAGPAALPGPVLKTIQGEILDWRETGQSVLEMPFTGEAFACILGETEADLRQLLDIPENYCVLFMQGGAYGHSALVPLNLFKHRSRADYVETGHWSKRAIGEARRYGTVSIAASGADCDFTRIPPRETWRLDPEAAYCHITTNETGEGLQFHWLPDIGDVPLVADMTSDFLSRPLDVSRFGLIYLSAQKNVGTSGLTLVIARQDLLDGALPETPAVFDYARQAKNNSKVNTPPTFPVYVAGLVLKWIKQQGGLKEMEHRNRRKSQDLYAAIDGSGFYRCQVAVEDRSWMNVCFNLPSPSLEDAFLAAAEARGLLNLKGHSAIGGIRASLYNAIPQEAVEALIAFMDGFAQEPAGG